jgi:type III secretory pathway component EscT
VDAILEALGGEERIAQVIAVGLLVAARVMPLSILAPWLGLRGAPVMVRTIVALALAIALVPIALPAASAIPPAPLTIAALAVREALVGAVFAVATALPLHALDWAGRLVDTWRGAGMAEVIAPPTGERTSPLGDLQLMLGVALFLVLGGHRVALAAFADGFIAVPVGAVQTDAASLLEVAFGSLRLFAAALAFGVALAAPAGAAIVLGEVALGLVARASPQVPVFFAGMPLRAALGLAAVLLAITLIAGELGPAFRDAIDAASRLIAPLGP